MQFKKINLIFILAGVFFTSIELSAKSSNLEFIDHSGKLEFAVDNIEIEKKSTLPIPGICGDLHFYNDPNIFSPVNIKTSFIHDNIFKTVTFKMDEERNRLFGQINWQHNPSERTCKFLAYQVETVVNWPLSEELKDRIKRHNEVSDFEIRPWGFEDYFENATTIKVYPEKDAATREVTVQCFYKVLRTYDYSPTVFAPRAAFFCDTAYVDPFKNSKDVTVHIELDEQSLYRLLDKDFSEVESLGSDSESWRLAR